MGITLSFYESWHTQLKGILLVHIFLKWGFVTLLTVIAVTCRTKMSHCIETVEMLRKNLWALKGKQLVSFGGQSFVKILCTKPTTDRPETLTGAWWKDLTAGKNKDYIYVNVYIKDWIFANQTSRKEQQGCGWNTDLKEAHKKKFLKIYNKTKPKNYHNTNPKFIESHQFKLISAT